VIFVDASAIVAILTREPESDAFVDALESSPGGITSPIAVFEAALGVCRKRHASVREGLGDVSEFLGIAGIAVVSITERETETALDAFSRYGKGRGHPAQLNLGDCFSYAMSANHGARILFKGDDFVHTDLESARASPPV
jgi:ribonuclease VapC